MARRRTSPWVLIPPSLSLVYAIAVVIAAWSAPEKGFQAFVGQQVAIVDEGGPAEAAGLRAGDLIVAADGTAITSTLDYAFHVLQREPGEIVTLGIRRDGSELAIPIRFEHAPVPWGALVATLLATMLLVLGLIARIGRPDDPDARRFYRTAVIYAVFYVGALSWTRLIVHPVLGIGFLLAMFTAPAVGFSLSIDFPHRTTSNVAARRLRKGAYVASAILGTVAFASLLLAINDYSSGGGDRGLTLMVAAVSIQLTIVIFQSSIGLWFQRRAHAGVGGTERGQLRWVLFGQALCLLPALGASPFAIVDLQTFLLEWYKPFVVAIAILWFVSYGMAVLRVRLADVDALITSSLGYAAATGAAVVVYLLVILGAGWVTGRLVGDAGPWPHLAAGLSAAALFGPIRTRVGGWLDQRFFRDRTHYVESIRRVGESLARLREPEALAKEAVEELVEAVRAERGALYLKEDTTWTIAHSVGGDWPATPDAPEDGVVMRVPGGATGDPVALLVIGPRRSGDLYSSQDRDLLGALAAQLGVALGNARAYGRIAKLSRALETQNEEIRGLRDRLEDENKFLRARIEAATDGATLIGESKAIKELTKTIERVARSDASILVLGESGTGKGLVARTLHAASSRSDKPFLQVDCGAIAHSVFESELFGHERGAFTGAGRMRRGPIELADGGTLFLDEIGERPLDLQPKLLRVLQDREFLRVGGTTPVKVDVRVIAATHRNLDAMVAKGELREDLYFRLRVVELVVPPLRSRRSDLPALCESLLPRVAKLAGRRPRPLAPDALARMAAYGWPGNVRELENVLARALVLADGPEITAADLDLPDRPAPIEEIVDLPSADVPHDEVMESIEKKRLTAALRAAGGNQSHAAKALGMPRTTFINKLRRYGLL